MRKPEPTRHLIASRFLAYLRTMHSFRAVPFLVSLLPLLMQIPNAHAIYNVAMFWKRPSFTFNWPFTAGTDAQYTFGTSIELAGGVARLKASDQIDNDNTASGFAGGTLSGAAYDTTNNYVRLSQTGTPTNTAELDSSWTPKWSNLKFYSKMNGTGAVPTTGIIPDKGVGSCGQTSGAIAANYTAGKFNSGIDFGPDGYVGCTGTAINSISNNVTISGWVKTNGTIQPFNGLLSSVDYGVTPNIGLAISNDAGNGVYLAVNTSAQSNATCGYLAMPALDGNWHHLAFTIGSGSSKAYMDGVLVESCSYAHGGGFGSSMNPYFSNPISAGTSVLDEFGVWDTILTDSEVQTIYSRQFAKYSGTLTSRVMDAWSTGQSWTSFSWIPTLPFLKALPDYASAAVQNESSTDYSALVGSTGSTADNNLMSGIAALWHLDETTTGTAPGGKDIKDTSGNGNHGTLQGTYNLGGSGALNRAVEIGASGQFWLASTFHPFSGDFTISAWVYPKVVATGAEYIVLYDETYTTKGLRLGALDQGSGYVQWGFWTTESGGTLSLSAPGAVIANKWVHLVATYESSTSTGRLYVDGVQVASGTGTLIPPTVQMEVLGGGGFPLMGKGDEVAIWTRTLNATEIHQLYRRGANRVKHQVRVCTAANCSDDSTGANWKGPDGTNQTYFSELNNNTAPLAMTGDVKKSLPSMLFSAFTSPVGTSRYFQYRTILESDDTGTACNYGSGATWCSPELKSVTVDPIHYDSGSPTISSVNGTGFSSLSTWSETIGSGGCTGGVGYNLSLNNTNWYWWDASANSGAGGWVLADGTVAKSSVATTVSAQAEKFRTQVGAGTIYMKAFLKSSGTASCELDQVQVQGLQ